MTLFKRPSRRRPSWRMVILALSVGALGACSSTAQSTYNVAQEQAIAAQTLHFKAINPKISMATAYGDRSVGEHGTFGKFAANFITPDHTHTGAYHGVVLKGVMTNPFKGEKNPPKLTAGSYWYVPAGMDHATACVSDTPCEFYFHADGPFDFLPTQ